MVTNDAHDNKISGVMIKQKKLAIFGHESKINKKFKSK